MENGDEKSKTPGLVPLRLEEISEDAMSSLGRLKVIIGPDGPNWTMKDFENALWELGDGTVRTIGIARRLLDELETTNADDGSPLSPEKFQHRARRELEGLDSTIASVPPKYQGQVAQALDHALRLGGLMMELRMRERHLVEVTREKLMQEARRSGGEHRKDRTANDTTALVEFMHAKVTNGMTVRNAARTALKNKLGETEEGNRKRYEYWRNKKMGGVSPSLPDEMQSSGSSKHE